MRQRAAASLLYQSQYAEPAFRNLLNLIFLKIVGRILAFYRHGKQIRNLQSIHNQELEAKDREISRLNTLLEKAFKWFPMLREMLRMEKLCAVIGFTKDMIDCLLTRKEAIQCNGKIYSEEHRRKFEIKNNIFKVEKNPTDDSKLVLTINRQPISEWFKEQWEKLRQGLRQPTEEPRKSRGFKL